jgi:antiviral defense system Shedu protein SduA
MADIPEFLSTSKTVQVAMLGLAERAAVVRDGNTNLVKSNILGLKQVIPYYFYPMPLGGWNIVLAVRHLSFSGNQLVISIEEEGGPEIGQFALSLNEQESTRLPLTQSGQAFSPILVDGWMIGFMQLPNGSITIRKAGRHLAFLQQSDGVKEIIGELSFVVVDPIPLTAERVAALKSDPRATKAARGTVSCKKCGDGIKVYAGFDRMPVAEAEGYIWYENIPEEFTCKCGATTFDLRSTKANFFGLVGETIHRQDGSVSHVPLYEAGVIANISLEFRELLNGDPVEEVLQKFIERHPILLHQFPAVQLFYKPSLLSQFKADFGVVTPQKELILIEIEKTTTRLLNKNGGRAADLGIAFDQVRSWLHVTDDHRLAVMDDLGIDREMVSTVRGVVIAGRDGKFDPKHLRRLKAGDGGRISLLTYDDLARGMFSLAEQVQQL